MSGGGNGGGGASGDANRRNHHHALAPLRVPSSSDSRAMELQPILNTPLALSHAGSSGWANGNGNPSSLGRHHFDFADAAPPRLLRPPPQLPTSASTSGNATPVVVLPPPRNLPNPAPSAVWRVAARNLALILAWYFFSTCLSLWNRTLLGHGHGVAGRGAFPAPMFMTAMQFCVQIAMARFALWIGVEGDGGGGGRVRRSTRRSGGDGGSSERGSTWYDPSGRGGGGGRRRAAAAPATAAVLPSQHRGWKRLSGDAEQPELQPPPPSSLSSSAAPPPSSSPPRSSPPSPTGPSSSLAASSSAAEARGRSGGDSPPSPSSPSPAPSSMSWKAYLTQVVPNGVCTGLDIGLSNFSLSLISLSFYTMCKSTTPLFLLAFAFAWGLEKPSWSLAGVVAVISSGLMLLVYGEAHFDGVGFALVMTASALSGLRWTITQLLLQGGGGGGRKGSGASPAGAKGSGGGGGSSCKVALASSPPRSPVSSSSAPEGAGGPGGGGHGGPGGQGPVAVVAALMPIMAATVALVSLLAERLWVTLPRSPYFDSAESVALTAGLVAGGAAIAFAMVWVEFTVIKLTSALTFMVAGTFKEIVTVLAAVAFLGESFSRVNAAGLAVLVAGVALFNYTKYKKVAAEQRREQEQQQRCRPRDDEEEEEARAAAAAALSPAESGAGAAAGSASAPSSSGNSGEYDARGVAAVAAARKRRGGGLGEGGGGGSSVDAEAAAEFSAFGSVGGGRSATIGDVGDGGFSEPVVERAATPPGTAAGTGGSPLRPRGAAGGVVGELLSTKR